MNYTTKRGGTQFSSLEKLAMMDTVYITPAQAATALGCTPFYISQMAKDEQKRKDLGFPVIRVGNRTKIPRIPFLKVLGWEVQA